MSEAPISLDDAVFTIVLKGPELQNVMGAIKFTHGFLGGTSPETQDALIDIHDEILAQVKRQFDTGAGDE